MRNKKLGLFLGLLFAAFTTHSQVIYTYQQWADGGSFGKRIALPHDSTVKTGDVIFMGYQILTLGADGHYHALSGGGGSPTTSIPWDSVTGKPSISAVGLSGQWIDILNKPIPVRQDSSAYRYPAWLSAIGWQTLYQAPDSNTYGYHTKGYYDGIYGGASATIPPNIGSGFRVYSPQVPGFRTIFNGGGIDIDTSKFTDGLTLGNGLRWYFLPDYQGSGDSAFDNGTAFTNAIAAITASRYHSGVLFIPTGVWNTSTTITVPAGTHVVFVGAGSNHYGDTVVKTKIVMTTINTDCFDIDGSSTDFRDMDIEDAAEGTGTTSGAAIHQTSQFTHIENVVIKGFYNGLVETQNVYSAFHECTFYDQLNHGVDVSNSVNGDTGDDAFSNCNFFSNANATASSYYQTNGGGQKFVNCKFNAGTNAMVNCITLNMTQSTTDLFAANNSLENFTGKGYDIYAASGVTFGKITIEGGNISSFHGGSSVGISIVAADQDAISNVNINTIVEQTTTGILLDKVTGASISGGIGQDVVIGINYTDVNFLNVYGYNHASAPYQASGVNTYIFHDKELASYQKPGRQSASDKNYQDSTRGANGLVGAFWQSIDTTTPTVYVDEEFDRADVSDIAGSEPDTKSMGQWYSVFNQGAVNITTLGISSDELYSPAGNNAMYAVPTNLTDYDESITLVNGGASGVGMIGNVFDASNYLQVDLNAGNIYAVVNGSFNIVTLTTTTFTSGDVVHLRVRGNVAAIYKNSTLIDAGMFSSSLIGGHASGFVFASNTTARMDHFIISNQGTGANHRFGVAVDGTTVSGDGTPQHPLTAISGTAASGIYLPTATMNLGTAVVTADSAVWSQSGTTVTVSGKILLTPASNNTQLQIELSLPVPSLLNGGHALWGSGTVAGTIAAGSQNGSLALIAYMTNHDAMLAYITGSAAAAVLTGCIYTYQYQVQ